jgi:prepilin-type N-terminal cleavage/methylation domain-containing protein
MSFTRRLPLSARSSSRGGFTLVELLVVIGIIALLAGVALGPITGAMKTAKDNAAMQTTHSLYLADFQYSVDNTSQGQFADGTDGGAIAQELLNGGYITDPSIFYLAGGAATKFVGANAANSITLKNVSWDFYGVTGAGSGASTFVGVGTNDPDQLPLIWTTGNTITLPGGAGAYGPAVVNVPGGNPLGTDGIPVVYKSGSSAFKKTNVIGPPAQITQFVDESYNPPAGTVYAIRPGASN